MNEGADELKERNELLSYFKEQLDRTNYWLSFAEAKNGVLIALNAALIAAVSTFGNKVILWSIVCSICFTISCEICLISLFPNLKSKSDSKNEELKGNDFNLLFYKDISKISTGEQYVDLTCTQYFNEINDNKHDKLVMDFANEVLINSKIAVKKNNLFSEALCIDILALILAIVGFIAGR